MVVATYVAATAAADVVRTTGVGDTRREDLVASEHFTASGLEHIHASACRRIAMEPRTVTRIGHVRTATDGSLTCLDRKTSSQCHHRAAIGIHAALRRRVGQLQLFTLVEVVLIVRRAAVRFELGDLL